MADQQRNKSNSYFAKQNHIAVKKAEVTKSLILDAAVQRANALGKAIASNVDGGWSGGTQLESSILALFANSEHGAWYDIDDLSTLAANPDGTGAVSVGGPVGYVADKSGNGNHLTVVGDARPILRQDAGGKYYLEFDGIDHWISSQSRVWVGTSGATVAGAVSLVKNGPVYWLHANDVDAGGGRNWAIDDTDARAPRLVSVDDGQSVLARDSANETFVDGVPFVVVGTISPTATELWVNGSSDGPTTYSSATMTTASDVFVPIGHANGSVQEGRFYGAVVVDRPATETERLAIHDWLAGLIGGLALLALLVDTESGQPVLDLRAPETELTVDAIDGRFDWLDGTTTLSLAGLDAGPVAVALPSWSGSEAPRVGDVVSPRLAAWAYLDGDPPTITREWLKGTVAAPGERWPTNRPLHYFKVPSGVRYDGLVYQETATNSAGTRAAAVQVVAPV